MFFFSSDVCVCVIWCWNTFVTFLAGLYQEDMVCSLNNPLIKRFSVLVTYCNFTNLKLSQTLECWCHHISPSFRERCLWYIVWPRARQAERGKKGRSRTVTLYIGCWTLYKSKQASYCLSDADHICKQALEQVEPWGVWTWHTGATLLWIIIINHQLLCLSRRNTS